jgi:hypothetical protein
MRAAENRKAGTGYDGREKRPLKPLLPVPWLSMSVCNCYRLDSRVSFSIEDCVWKSLEQDFPHAMVRRRPAFGRFGNHSDRPIHFFCKLRSYVLAAQKVPFESRFVFRTRIWMKSNSPFMTESCRNPLPNFFP